MALTALDIYERVARKVGLDPSITAFSNDDESNDVLQDMNEAYEELLVYIPDTYAGFNKIGTITLVASTRTYSVAADALNSEIKKWGVTDATNDTELEYKTREWVESLDPDYQTTEAEYTTYYYLEPDNKLAFYPVPSAAATITYEYSAAGIATRVSATTDTFAYMPDKWTNFIVHQAAAKYLERKGFDPMSEAAQAANWLSEIVVEVWDEDESSIRGTRGFA